ncbi:MAG TPA: class I SAM-dependent methyltransferase [Spongiibacteraceae bacterium]|nr:class I SAM-dependent methyltransferase [Spongiibacteraceae bacterium]
MTEHIKTGDNAVRVPHAPLTDYYPDESSRANFVNEMFDSTAEDYDRMENILGFGSGKWYRGEALKRAGLKPGMRVLDVGTGTGLVASEAIKIVGNAALITGVDPSPSMMANAKLPTGVQLLSGKAESLPVPDASVDFLSMGYALRHIGDLRAAFREFHRVLKPGGKLCLLEITCPESSWGKLLLKFYMKGCVPLLAPFIGHRQNTRRLWRYYWDTIEACLPPEQIVAELTAAGFNGARRYIDVRAMSIFAEYQAEKSHEEKNQAEKAG